MGDARPCRASPAHAGMHLIFRPPPPDFFPASPAHAGMHRINRLTATDITRFPRTRGDAPAGETTGDSTPWLPPHTRGCTLATEREESLTMASPAHAGMHPEEEGLAMADTSFPRTRGDAPVQVACYWCEGALPPHTRGCTGDGLATDIAGAASPAHAGMHPWRRMAATTCACSAPRT